MSRMAKRSESFHWVPMEMQTMEASEEGVDDDVDGNGNLEQFPHSQFFTAILTKKWEEVFMLIENRALRFQDFSRPDPHSEWNILQYACNIDSKSWAAETVIRIFEIIEGFNYDGLELDEFVNYSDSNGTTALHIAVSKGHEQVVEDLILHSADINMLGNEKREVALRLIHNRLHKIMIRLFDGGLNVLKNDYDASNELCWSLECDFTPITGVKSNRDKKQEYLFETRLLTTLLSQEKYKRVDILLHPLVQIFLHLKGRRFQWPIRFSVFYHILWLVVNVTFIASHTKWLDTDKLTSNSTSKQEHNCTQSLPIDSYYASSYLIYTKRTGFQFNLIFSLVATFYLITLINKLIELKTCPNIYFYWSKFENTGVWVVLVTMPVAYFVPMILYFNDISSDWADNVFKSVYFITLILSLLLIQGRTSKLQSVGIYNEMLIKTFKRFLVVFLAFSPTLVTFMIAFHLLLPEHQEFNPIWGFGFPKILSMMVGELTYDEIFHDSSASCVPYPMTTRLVFLLFVVFVVILLQNLLIGLTVDDIEKLSQECLANHLATRLETIHILENVIFSRAALTLLALFKAQNIINWLLVSPVSIEVEERNMIRTQVISKQFSLVKMTRLPPQLRQIIKTKYQ